MRTGQRDMHNTPLKRRLSITYEELETLKKSIKVSVLNELRTEMENVSDQDSIKDLVLSEIRTELMGIPNPALLKASILNEIRTELKTSGENDSEKTERKLKELTGVQDGLVRELLDHKTLIKNLRIQIENLTRELDDAKKTVPVAQPPDVPSSLTLDLPEDPLDLPPLSRKLDQKKEFQNEKPAYRLGKFREAPASLPGTGAKVKLKFKEIEPAELDREDVETKCEYIIAENGDKRWPKGTVRQQPSVKQPSIKELAKQRTSIKMERQQPSGKLFPQKQPSVDRAKPAETQHVDNYKCEYIIADRISKKYLIEESVDVRENEDAEVITCSRKSSREQ